MAVTAIAGLSVEDDQRVLAACAARAALDDPGELPPITDLGILTAGTPALLRRSVTSWTGFARQHGRQLDITIVDDSPTPDRAAEQRREARALEGDLGVRLRFVGTDSRLQISRALARQAGVEPGLLDFAVSGRAQPRVGIGGSRNLLNLITTGRRVLSADDDIIPAFEVPPPNPLALWITAEEVPMHTYFFDSVEESEARVPVSATPDAVVLHESFVGHTVAGTVARLSGTASLRGAGPDLKAAIQDRPVRIAATALGLTGDCASDCLGFFSLISGGDSEQRVLARAVPLSPSREVLRRPEFPILCQGVYFITFCHAMDNTLPLPPAFPVGRGEDQVWQKLLHYSMPDTVVAHLPLAVRHRPDGARQYTPDDYLDPCRSFPGNAFILGLLGSAPPPATGQAAGARLAAMGRYLAHAAGEPARFAGLVQGAWRAYLGHHHSLVAAAIAGRAGHPAWWHDNMRTVRGNLERHSARTADIPLEYGTLTGAAAIDALRPDVQRFGRLLEAWAGIRDAAATLAGQWRSDPGWLRP